WQMSLMSYFSQPENTTINASYAFTATPMLADILAIQQLYGTTGTIRDGNTTYGEDSNAGGYYETLDFSNMTFTIYDEGGVDWIKFKTETADMVVDLAEEAISSVGGETNNMIIARGTIIENFFAGSGNDIVIGNDAANKIFGGAGDDWVEGLGGGDTLVGGRGDDVLRGNSGDDVLRGNTGYDTLTGNDGNDTLYGNAGNDGLVGGAGNDILFGGLGRDLIWGGDGDDRLVGGRSMDKLIGGAGSDTFVFNVGDGKDRIRDFEAGIDILEIETGAWGSGVDDISVTVYDNLNGYIQLEFSTGTITNIIQLAGITDIADISGDFVFI
ncbi:MAG: M10 family metallopeptidase C-terminal domain-containing protein, partial [Rhodobacteraceae bacterium]|nr:M10 family metallopeptidase C-terminal domain-containing protein [Paracoccaceae bacterium]